MAAESTKDNIYTFHVKNLAGSMTDIENMDVRDYVVNLKNKIRDKLDVKFKMIIRLTYEDDNSANGFTELEDLRTLNSYPIINKEAKTTTELNLVINIPIITDPITSDERLKWHITNNNLLDPIPLNTEVVNNITPDMVRKTIYILKEPNAKNGLQCDIDMVGSNADVPQSIQIHVIQDEEKLTLEIRNGNQITKALRTGRVRLLTESNSSRAVAQGGRRSRRTKHTLCKRRRTHRKHRK